MFVRPPDDGGRGSRIRVSNAIVRRRDKTKCLPTKPYLLVCVLLDHAVFRRNLIDRADKLSQLVRERVGERVCGERGAGWGGLVMLPNHRMAYR